MRSGVIYFPGLNGLRAISALAVVVSHITLALSQFGLNPYIFGSLNDGTPRGISLAGYGVTIFFVLSGFLITYLLLVEQEKAGRVSISKFYIRRILRIWPLYYLYLVISLLVAWKFSMNFDQASICWYIFYAPNVPFILGATLPFLAHYWSLGVEEQFYLIWPWIIRRIKNPLPYIFGFALIVFSIKSYLHFKAPDSLLEIWINVARFHVMVVGAIGAILYKNNSVLFIKIANHRLAQTISWLAIMLAMINRFYVPSFISNEIIAVVGLILIIGQIKRTNCLISLETSFFEYLGKISYGIYVVHPLIIFAFSRVLNLFYIESNLIKYIIIYVSITFITILVSHFSYYYFERYFLKLKNRFVVVESSGVGLVK
jgi:peptidoglycan/LPS O-acetylase OafA/YrhL